MAEAVKEKKKPPVETIDNESRLTQFPAQRKSGGIKRMFIMLLGLQLITAAGAFAFVKFYLAPKIQYAAGESGVSGNEGREIHLISLLVNPAGTNGTRYLSTSVGIETAKKAGGPEFVDTNFEKISPIIKDVLISTLSLKTMEELSSIEAKTLLRDEILIKLNQAVSPDSIYGVYFVDYALR